MNRTVVANSILAFVTVAAAGSLTAQEPPGPSPELKKLEPMVGHWKGKGTAVMAPGAPAIEWNATVRCQWVLNDYFLQTDSTIDFGPIGTMRLREYIGWDAENQKFAQIQVGNSGVGNLVNPVVQDGGACSWFAIQAEGDSLHVERVTSGFSGDAWNFGIQFLGPAGPLMEAVDGEFEKVDEVKPMALGDAAPIMPVQAMPGHETMAKVARMAGEYEFQGEMTMPGMGTMKITGHDTIHALFGGAVTMVVTKGVAEGMPETYEAHGFQVWNPVRGCIESLFVSNMGEIGAWQGWLTDDETMVSLFSGVQMGQPTTKRMVMKLDGDGRPQSLLSHTCMGTGAPMVDFKGTYKHVE